MRLSLELVVTVIVLLVVAVVVLSIFTGGIENFMRLFGGQSDQQIKYGLCGSACANFCMANPDKPSGTWGTEVKVMYQGKDISSECSGIYNKPQCECNR